MTRMRGVLLGLLGASAALSACSILVDTAGLAGGDDPSENDAALDGGPGDGEARGNKDGAGITDADVRDAPAGDADGAAPCVDGPTRFCDDFDELNPGAKWTNQVIQRGLLGYDDGDLSPPHALHATVHAGTGEGEALLGASLATAPSKVRCELDLELGVVSASGEVDIIDISSAGTSATDHVYVASFDGQWALAEYETAPDGGAIVDRQKNLGLALPVGTWFHVVLDSSATSATLTMNGASVTLSSLSVPAANARSIAVGITYASNSAQNAGVFIDNVDCTSQ